jgi:FkbM family methyltransferase
VTLRANPSGLKKHNDLVIDVGFHRGGAARFYLDKGFRCIAVEINPFRVEEARTAFAEDLADGRLRIFGVAVAEQSGTAPLAVAAEETDWSSLCPGFVERNANLSGTHYRTVDVPAIRFEDVLEVGIPRYLKVDTEGFDMLCARALRVFDERPDFVSLEPAVSSRDAPFENAFEERAELWSLGYRHFAYVDKTTTPLHQAPKPPRGGHYIDTPLILKQSGYFGDEMPERWASIGTTLLRAEALRIHHNLAGYSGAWAHNPLTRPFAWLTTIASRLRRPFRRGKGRSWYDLHARSD